jgi:serine/threonine-protein kinase
VGAQIADALSAAHKLKIVHRDLKPDNVMLEPRDDGSRMVKVLDFGIARVADERIAASGQNLTRVGTVIGTPGYMAPEQALGENIDLRADLYALGLLLYEMTTGERVFDLDDLTAIVTRQLTEDAPRISDEVAGVPTDLDDLVASMLTKDRDARPESAAVVRDTLRKLLLGATLQKVASGEHVIPLGTTELAGSSNRDPTPLGIPLPRPEADKAPAAVAPTMMSGEAAIPTPALGALATGAPATGAPATGVPVHRAAAAATARTALALGRVKRDVEKAGVPVKPIGIGCGVVSGALLSVLALSAILGDDSEFQKREHARPEVREPDSPEGPTAEEVTREVAAAVPSELAQPLADLLISDSDRVRTPAARAVLAHEPRDEVPELAVALAELERATSCNNKKEQLARLVRLGDPRALPALERIDAAPRNGCRRMFRRFDCYGCMRDELTQAIETLRSEM